MHLKMNHFFKFSKQCFTTTKRKKFYKIADILEVNNTKTSNTILNSSSNVENKLKSLSQLRENYYHIVLDGRKCLSAYQDEFMIPSKRLAMAIAAEYQQQKDFVEFNYMPLVLGILI